MQNQARAQRFPRTLFLRSRLTATVSLMTAETVELETLARRTTSRFEYFARTDIDLRHFLSIRNRC